MEMEDGEIVINGIGHRLVEIDRLKGEADEAVEDETVVAKVEEAAAEVDMTILNPVDDNHHEIFHHQEEDTVAARMTIEGHTPDREVHPL